MARWAIELSEYDIEFKSRTSAKSQVLADFIVEIPPELATQEDEQILKWTLHVDGSSSRQGAGVGIRLVSPTGEILEQSLKLGFPASNNEAEYEAIIAGLRLAEAVGAEHVRAFCDSQLVAKQFSGDYDAKDDRMDASPVPRIPKPTHSQPWRQKPNQHCDGSSRSKPSTNQASNSPREPSSWQSHKKKKKTKTSLMTSQQNTNHGRMKSEITSSTTPCQRSDGRPAASDEKQLTTSYATTSFFAGAQTKSSCDAATKHKLRASWSRPTREHQETTPAEDHSL
ncbi:unnamed protein product [Microthlaspi erraticum]|uniref:RNase H type-1 domain-containing protein n=1 Tax=Microthlaspi erraticum TaxID=1685480 RepID=A0A6D2HT58_9BRAS|nr:unnamed protein product [Microthlaspi erraticum]